MKKEFSSWLLLGLFLVVMCSLFIFTFKEKIFGTIQGSAEQKDVQSKESVNILEKVLGTKLLKCSKETTEDKIKETEKITITYKGETLKVYESEQITDGSEKVDEEIGIATVITDAFSKLDGITMKTIKLSDSSYKIYTKIVYDELNDKQLAKLSENENTKDMSSSNIFKKSDIGLNEYQFKLEKDGYTCK